VTVEAVGAVLNYHLVTYVRTWRGSVLSSFVLPVLFVLGFGVSVGSLVNARGSLGGQTYLEFIVPGMIASTAMQVAFGESSWPVLARFKWIGIYDSMTATPLRVREILAGDITYLLFRIITTSAVFLGVTAAFGAVASWWGLLVPLFAAMVGLAFAAPIMALTAKTQTGNSFPSVYRFIIVPMSLFAGVFFPVSALGIGLRWLAYISPLWHGVELCRAATSVDHGSMLVALGHVAYLLVWCVVGTWLALVSFRRRLSD
jgi:lipooligosaccharide transport system permease protein